MAKRLKVYDTGIWNRSLDEAVDRYIIVAKNAKQAELILKKYIKKNLSKESKYSIDIKLISSLNKYNEDEDTKFKTIGIK